MKLLNATKLTKVIGVHSCDQSGSQHELCCPDEVLNLIRLYADKDNFQATVLVRQYDPNDGATEEIEEYILTAIAPHKQVAGLRLTVAENETVNRFYFLEFNKTILD
jgi:cytochrome oxidase Cu insertion factor (SCO1/SenC/PrrC family)